LQPCALIALKAASVSGLFLFDFDFFVCAIGDLKSHHYRVCSQSVDTKRKAYAQPYAPKHTRFFTASPSRPAPQMHRLLQAIINRFSTVYPLACQPVVQSLRRAKR
jgi:hypothetical protein